MIRPFSALAFTFCLATILPVPAVRAAATITFSQSGSNVIATGSGTLNFTALTLGSTIGVSARVNPSIGNGFLGPTTTGNMSVYTGITGPTSFGTAGATLASSGSGNLFGIAEGATTPGLGVPQGYTSGAALSATDTWTNNTIAGLGLTPNTYTWTWGSGSSADSLTIVVPSAVPEPNSATLIGVGVLALVFAGTRGRRLFRS